MPVQLTYPGVYVEELPSGQHTISPVSTSVAAFVGRALFGPVDVPTTIFSYGDFIRYYGGLQFDYPMSYAVQDFFDNGGSQAVIARLFEPNAPGDGIARLKFPGAPPMLPVGFVLDAAAAQGTSSVVLVDPTNSSEGEPNEGMTVTFAGDATPYTVTGYAPANLQKQQPATITVVPALKRDLRKCTAATFAQGPEASGWTLVITSGSTLQLGGGTGIPLIGQRIVGAGDPTPYTVIAEPVVHGTDPSALQLTVSVTPKPSSSLQDGQPVTISDPQPMPMPQGWEFDGTPAITGTTGTVGLINGMYPPQAGDVFTYPGDPATYAVTGFAPATAKAPATLSFTTIGGAQVTAASFCECCAPAFDRQPPRNLGLKAGVKAGATSFGVARLAGAAGTLDVGDTFTVGSDPTEYAVRFVDAGTTVYFLPEAKNDWSATDALTFQPPLGLMAASPGKWGNRVTARADTKGITDATAHQFAQQYGLAKEDLFNLTLTLEDSRGRIAATETFVNLSVRKDGEAGGFPNRIDRVLSHQSNLARVERLSGIPPANGATAAGLGGDDGTYLAPSTFIGDPVAKTGMYLLKKVDIFNLLCIPPDRRILDDVPEAEQELDPLVLNAAAGFCADRRAMFIVDPPVAWKDLAHLGQLSQIDPSTFGIGGLNAAGIEVGRNAAVFFPRLWKEDPVMKSPRALFVPCGAIAGVIAATDVSRGVWKAPAGTDAALANVKELEVRLDDDENGQLNPLGINCLRSFPVIGNVVWGSRTLRGADAFADDYKYIPVRRLTLFVEESLLRGTQWAVFEPNDEALWSSLRLAVGSFLAGLSRQGAFYNYNVACDATTTTADDIARGIVNIVVQIAPVKPAEFVVLQIQQVAAKAAS